jgi:hypothetical protein
MATTAKQPAPAGFDLRKTLSDAGYIAVGLGVLGVQQAQTRRHHLQEQLEAKTARLREQAQSFPSRVSEQFGSLDLNARLDAVRTRANEIGEQTRARVVPVLDQIESRVNELPEPLPSAAAPVVKVARQLVAA